MGEKSHYSHISEKKSYKTILAAELYRVERDSQQQAGWFMAICLVLIYVIILLQADALQDNYRQFIDTMVIIMLSWFVGYSLLIRQGYYHRVLKYINILFQISMVSIFIIVSADIMGTKFALSSVASLYYMVVIGISSLTMNPFLCLLAGGLVAGQFLGMYVFLFHDDLFVLNTDIKTEQALFGWASMIVRSVIFLIVGIAAMLMARKARSLLETVVVQVRYEEELNFLERDISHAAEIQKQLVPTKQPDFPRLVIESYYQPSKEVGGDYFDFIERADQKKLVVIADVAGKGFSAAMVMSNIQAMIQVLAQQDISMESLASIVNQSVIKNSARGCFISMVYFEFYPDKEYFRYLNCGHNPPLLFNQSGVRILEANAPVIGVAEGEYSIAPMIEYGNGDLIFTYTDGLSELRNEQRELLGEAKIEEILQSKCDLDAPQIKQHMLQEVAKFHGQTAPTDDLSFMVIKRKAAEG